MIVETKTNFDEEIVIQDRKFWKILCEQITFSKMSHGNLMCLFFPVFFYTFIEAGATCDSGLYGPSCNLKCSPGCRDRKCKLASDGTAPCTEGCEPGWYGSWCKVPCQSPADSCQKCPSKCENGFCQLGSRCVSGCVDSYYGTGCFTCEPDCQVCNKYAGRCYNCADGCPFTSCYKQGRCESNLGQLSKNIKLGVFHWLMLTAGVGIGVVVVVLPMMLIKLMKKRRHPSSSEYCQTFRQDGTEDYTELRRSEVGSYIHAVNDHNDDP